MTISKIKLFIYQNESEYFLYLYVSISHWMDSINHTDELI